MSNKNELLITKEGLEKLKGELTELLEVRRPEVINRIKTAKEYGDLSENAEYSAAKDDQSFVEGRIQELEQAIKTAKVVNNGNGELHGTVGIGSKLTVEIEGETDTFEIVGPAESDPAKGKISTDSPVGKAMLGHKAKETVNIETPDGKVAYIIVSVS